LAGKQNAVLHVIWIDAVSLWKSSDFKDVYQTYRKSPYSVLKNKKRELLIKL
jgi:hypothetical protein